jgi:predicted MFS family arabinose efflux permease
MLFARIFTGAFGGMLNALVLSIVGDAIAPERRAAGVGFVMAGFSVASAIGVPSGLYIATHWGWHAPFILLGVLAALTVVQIYFFVPSMRGHLLKTAQSISTPQFLKSIFQNKNQMLALLMSSMLVFGQFSIIPFLSAYMVNNVGFTQEQLTYIYLSGGCVTLFTSPLIGRLADKHGRRIVFTVFGLLCVIPLVVITNLPHMDNVYWVLLISTFFWIVIGGRMIPAMAIVTSTVPPQNRGSFMSINASVQNLSSGLSSLVAAQIITTEVSTGRILNYQYVGVVAVVFSLFSVWIGRKIATVEQSKPTIAA